MTTPRDAPDAWTRLLAVALRASSGRHAEAARNVVLTILLAQLLAGAAHEGPPHVARRPPRRGPAPRPRHAHRTHRHGPSPARLSPAHLRLCTADVTGRQARPAGGEFVLAPDYFQAMDTPDGIPGSVLTGPYPVGTYAAALRERLRGFTRVQVFGEVFGFKAGRAKVWFELRDPAGALPCSMWREDFDKLRLGTLADGAQVVVAGGCDYYPGSRTASPGFSFAVTRLRVAGEGDLLAQLEQLRRRLHAEGLFAPQKALVAAGAPALHRGRHG